LDLNHHPAEAAAAAASTTNTTTTDTNTTTTDTTTTIALKFHPKHVTNKNKTKYSMKIAHISFVCLLVK
jgi:hypothetical protein